MATLQQRRAALEAGVAGLGSHGKRNYPEGGSPS